MSGLHVDNPLMEEVYVERVEGHSPTSLAQGTNRGLGTEPLQRGLMPQSRLVHSEHGKWAAWRML